MMGRNLIDQALRPAAWGGILVAALTATVRDWPVAGGFLVGVFWNVLNLALLHALGDAWGQGRGRRALALLAVKLLVLYPAGLWLAMSRAYSLVAILAGFTWTFAAVIVVAAWPRSHDAGSSCVHSAPGPLEISRG